MIPRRSAMAKRSVQLRPQKEKTDHFQNIRTGRESIFYLDTSDELPDMSGPHKEPQRRMSTRKRINYPNLQS